MVERTRAGLPPTTEPGSEVLKEGGRAAQIKIAFTGYAQLLEDGNGEPANSIVVNAQPVSRVGPAVLDVGPGMGHLSQQFACFSGKGMIQAVPRSIDPPDISLRSFSSECVQH